MREYLELRNNLYVTAMSRFDNVEPSNDPKQITAVLKQAAAIITDVKDKATKLSTYEAQLVQTVEQIIGGLENKISNINNIANTYIATQKYMTDGKGSVSIIDLTSGKNDGLIYSATDGGIILDS